MYVRRYSSAAVAWITCSSSTIFEAQPGMHPCCAYSSVDARNATTTTYLLSFVACPDPAVSMSVENQAAAVGRVRTSTPSAPGPLPSKVQKAHATRYHLQPSAYGAAACSAHRSSSSSSCHLVTPFNVSGHSFGDPAYSSPPTDISSPGCRPHPHQQHTSLHPTDPN